MEGVVQLGYWFERGENGFEISLIRSLLWTGSNESREETYNFDVFVIFSVECWYEENIILISKVRSYDVKRGDLSF